MHQNIIITSPANISVKDGRLSVHTDKVHFFPVEDLNVVVLDNRQSKISSYALDLLSENGTTVIVCGSNHHPAGVLLPFGAYSRRLPMIKLQFSQSKPKLKRIWQQIIRQKIKNQGKCLELAGKYDCVSCLVDKVKSGDAENMEGYAAKVYFTKLFDDYFVRRNDSVVNSMLNYGYAVLRACIAKHIAVYGLEPSVGIFHHNEQNNFNLADDLLEVFRPVVDLFVSQYEITGMDELDTSAKSCLVELLMAEVIIKGMRQSVSYAMEQVVQGLVRVYRGEAENLDLPCILPIKVHEYE